ncbi:MAG: ATP-dependent Clp protease proteolytic subunit [Actinomycetota bacterium]|nr:ATP-dependent Clp protease proteolytic subunit [Actinomycetota bacterium]
MRWSPATGHEQQEERPSPRIDLPRIIHFARLFERRLVFLSGPLHDEAANQVCAQLLALDADSGDDITFCIDSPGGELPGLFAIYDTVQLLGSRVDTRCIGLAASAAAVILAGGTGRRSATEHARILLHQPHGSARGRTRDLEIQAREIASRRARLEEVLAERTGQSLERVRADMEHDHWLSAQEAREYGLIDEVTSSRRLRLMDQ